MNAAASSPVVALLLGASNLARSHAAVAARLQRGLAPREVQVLSALGPGRAYRSEGGFLHVRYPPIATSGALEATEARAAAGNRVAALVTDIGNDILYGVPVEALVETLGGLLARLRAMDAAIVATAIPVDVRADVSELRFRLVRRALFPASRVGYEEAARAVEQVNAFLAGQAGAGVHLVRGLRPFLGIDRIHYSVRHGHRAWTRITAAMLGALGAAPVEDIGRPEMSMSLAAAAGRALGDMTGRRRTGEDGRF